jgi:hypothetical protein
MNGRTREPGEAVRRVLENAGILIFASLLVMSVALGRYSGALVWCGALIVFFVHTWESRSQRLHHDPSVLADAALRSRHYDALRWLGLALSLTGAAVMSV